MTAGPCLHWICVKQESSPSVHEGLTSRIATEPQVQSVRQSMALLEDRSRHKCGSGGAGLSRESI